MPVYKYLKKSNEVPFVTTGIRNKLAPTAGPARQYRAVMERQLLGQGMITVFQKPENSGVLGPLKDHLGRVRVPTFFCTKSLQRQGRVVKSPSPGSPQRLEDMC